MKSSVFPDSSIPGDNRLADKHVVMMVWNGFTNDARVMREAESLTGCGMEVSVIAILTPARELESEKLSSGIRIRRVSRKAGIFGRLLMLPRNSLRLVLTHLVGKPAAPKRNAPKWWEVDRRLVFLVSELLANLRMYRHARALRPDVVHAHDVNTLLPAWLAAKRSGAHLVYDAHEISADREGYHGRIRLVRLVERILGNAADGRITTTDARADWFRETYGYPDMTVLQNRPVRRIVPNGNRIRREFGIPDDRIIVLYQGGLQWGRGLRNLLEAVRDLPNAHLVFVGDGVQRASLEEAAAEMRDRVHFAGMVSLDELPEWTASADIGVQCLRNTCLNHYTTDSNKLFEYVMGGLPVVASDFPEIRRVVEAHDLGFLVDPDNVKAIHDALKELVQNVALRERYAANARKAREMLDWSSQRDALLALYANLH